MKFFHYCIYFSHNLILFRREGNKCYVETENKEGFPGFLAIIVDQHLVQNVRIISTDYCDEHHYLFYALSFAHIR